MTNMEIEGVVINVLPVQSGTSAKGGWQKQEFIIETPGQYPKKLCVSLWGDKVPECPAINDQVKVSINLESREYNGRWYTEVRVWKIVKTSIDTRQPPTWTSTPAPTEKPANFKGSGDDWDKLNNDGDDGLPF